jgi:hypothetical protein
MERKCSRSFFYLHNKVLGHIRNYEIPHTVQLSWNPQDILVFQLKHLVQLADIFSSFWTKCTMLAYFIIDMSFLSYMQTLLNLLSLANTFNVTEHISISWNVYTKSFEPPELCNLVCIMHTCFFSHSSV